MLSPSKSGLFNIKQHIKNKNLFLTVDDKTNNFYQALNTDSNYNKKEVIQYRKLSTINKNKRKSKSRVLLPNKIHLQYLTRSQEILDQIYKNMPEKYFTISTDTNDKTKSLYPKFHRKKNRHIPLIDNETENNNESGNDNNFDYNVYDEEDETVKNLLNKFKIKNQQKKLPKIEKNKLALNQLYGITSETNEKIAKVKHRKKLSLEDYQTKILTTLGSNGNIGVDELTNLLQNLKELKIDSESVQPLPPINIKIIYEHVLNNQKKHNIVKSKSIREILNEKEEPKDEFEKEERMIKKIQRGNFKKIKIKKNGHLNVLPPYLKNFFKYT